jgi:Ca2+-binding RTX toxin-like protein
MSGFNFFNFLFGGLKIDGSDKGDLIFGSLGSDEIAGNGGDDLIIDLLGAAKIAGGDGDDTVYAGLGDDTVEGGEGEDALYGGAGDDRVVGNKGNDRMFGGAGNDRLVWNNGDGSDLMDGGAGADRVQVNFNTDLVNDDLQNADVAAFSTTEAGVQFARVELNGQAEQGLFQLDIRETETLETNFGDGDDAAQIIGKVLDDIELALDGGDGVDTLDLSQAGGPLEVDLAEGKLGNSSAVNFENVIGTEFDDTITGDAQNNVISGLGGVDTIKGMDGDDTLVANKGNDFVYGGDGNDKLIWNNGDGSDLMDGGADLDVVQVNFNTDLVNDDLQNKDVAEFSVTEAGVQFARIEVNDQTEAGLFQLDIRDTETLETNFGGGDDAAVIVGTVLDEIELALDGGDGIDLLDFSQAAEAVTVDLAAGTIATALNLATGEGAPGGILTGGSGAGPVVGGEQGTPIDVSDIDLSELFLSNPTAVNFENVTGTAFDDVITGNALDNVIRGGSGNDTMSGGGGADTFVFFLEDEGVDVILDFEFGVDQLVFATNDPDVTTENLLGNLTQVGDDVELALNNKVITFEDAEVDAFTSDAFMIL